jgi:hypothetical protein
MDPLASGLELALSAFQSRSAQHRRREDETLRSESEVALFALDKLQELKDRREFVQRAASISLKEFLLSEDYCAPYLRASAGGGSLLSPVAEAIVDAIEGNLITTLTPAQHERIFGCAIGKLTPKRAISYYISAGGRSGKTSRFLTCIALWCAWTVPLPTLSPGEEAFAFITAPKRVLAKRCIKFVSGCVSMSRVLSAAIVKNNVESVLLKRPDGKLVSIEVSAKGNLSGRGGTCLFYGVDEAEFFLDTAAQDLDEQIKGAEQRIVPGGMVGVVSTPFIEGEGVMQQVIARERGKHEGALVIEKVITRELNTSWDPDGIIEKNMRCKPGGDLNVDREVYAIPYPRGTKRFFNTKKLREAMSRLANKQLKIHGVGAGSDLGFRRDGSGLVIAKRYQDMQIDVPRMYVERPTDGPLIPSIVCSNFARIAREHGASAIATDGHYVETMRKHLSDVGLGLIDSPTGREGKLGMFVAAYQVFHDDRICLGEMPEDEREDLIDQLSRITTKKLPGGGEEIIIPRRVVRTEADAGAATTDHCDGAAAFVTALWACGAGEMVARAQDDAPPPAPVQHRADGVPKIRGVTFGTVQKGGWRR